MKNSIVHFFIFSCITGTVIYVLQKSGVHLPSYINFYVNDFLIIPIVLAVCLYILRWTKNDKYYTISLFNILYLCLLYSIIFEYILPKNLDRYTADIIDVFLYFLGGLTFYILQKLNIKTNSN